VTVPVDWAALVSAAAQARTRAYAPYSGFAVGAALLADDGRVFTGCNVENASYGLSLCAERNAVGQAVTAGARVFAAIAIVAPGPNVATPCGMCRQVLSELAPSIEVLCMTPEGVELRTSVAALLPHGFGPGHLEKP
jgi:cytidine deaminase